MLRVTQEVKAELGLMTDSGAGLAYLGRRLACAPCAPSPLPPELCVQP